MMSSAGNNTITNMPLIIEPLAIINVISLTMIFVVISDTDRQQPASIATEVIIETPLSVNAV